MNKQIGFTLVEISIVLIIIGLILGGLFVGGQALIANTKATGTVKLIQDLTSAVSDFKARYHYLPGDLPIASQEFSGIPSGTLCDKGNGNGLIEKTPDEVSCVSQHLVLGGFIKGSAAGIVSPLNPGPSPDVFVMAAKISEVNVAAVNPFPATVQNVIEIGTAAQGIPCDAALSIDGKIDDGDTQKGNVMSNPPCVNGGGGMPATTILDVGL